MKKEIIGSLIVFYALFLLFLRGGLCQDYFEWNVTYAISLHEDGTATITIEKRALLENENDTSMFYSLYVKSSFDRQREFSGNLSKLINQVWFETNREHARSPVEYFAGVGSTETAEYGIVKYKFDWIGFAEETNESCIIIGDVFIEGFFLLGDGTLKVEYPPGYTISNANPQPENIESNTLIWNTEKLHERQPTLILEKKKTALFDYFRENPLITGLITILGTVLATILIYRVKSYKPKAQQLLSSGEDDTGEISDEQRIINLLKAAGGTLVQSKITEKLGCSKAKVSKLLALMENKGILKRKKRGREKIVTLIDEKGLSEDGNI